MGGGTNMIDNIVKNHNHKLAQSNNCIDELYDDKIIETKTLKQYQ